MSEIFYAKIIKQNKSGTYVVKRVYGNLAENAMIENNCRLMSPIPANAGMGMSSKPIDLNNLFCMCVKDGPVTMIIGFDNIGSYKASVDTEAGGFKLEFGGASHIAGQANGTLSIFTDPYSQMIMEPGKQSLYSVFRNMITNWHTGAFNVYTNDDEGTAEFYFAKSLDKTTLPMYAAQNVPDNIKVTVGANDSDAMVVWKIKQDYILKNAGITLEGSLGKNEDELSSYKYETKTSSGSLRVLDDSSIEIIGKGTNTFKHKLSTTGDVVELIVNEDKAVVTIDAEGNILFKLTDTAKMYLGGKTKAQRLVTESFIKNFYETHVHLGNLGAPTGPPMPPSPSSLDLGVDSKSGVFTQSTYAE